jgi:ATP-dependent DNA helicase PIF1
MTGTASYLIGGQTLHSYLGLGIKSANIEELIYKINTNKPLKNKWLNLKLLIIDEISMLSNVWFDVLEKTAKIIRQNSSFFGGVCLLFSGDFLQIPCIKDKFCFQSKKWNTACFKIYLLQKNKRQIDGRFQNILCNARLGTITDDDVLYLQQNNNTLNLDTTIIVSCNDKAVAINNAFLKQLPSRTIFEYKLKGVDTSVNYINISSYCNAPKVLRLKKNAKVVLLANIDIQNGLVNGSQGTVIDFTSSGMPIIKFNQIQTVIKPHLYEFVINNKSYSVRQLPLRLSYAITIHKSQGMTIEKATIDLSNIFEYGQAYVALSRVRSVQHLTIINIDKTKFKAHPDALKYYCSL